MRILQLRSARALGIYAAVALFAQASFAAPAGNRYVRRNLVSDSELRAENADPGLVNGWGIAASSTGPWWVNAADAGLSLVYNGEGGKLPLAVAIPGVPTGIVFDGGSRFTIPGGGSAVFIFASADGTISAWSSDLAALSPAVVMVDNSGDAAYTGLAIDSTTDGNRLFAADFSNARVDVFDGSFNPIATDGGFSDPHLPNHYAPFGIQTLAGSVYVSYAQQNGEGDEEVLGKGKGIVDKYDFDGHFLARVVTKKTLNAPWGMALAPAGFGRFSGKLLIGNFGDGMINAFDPVTFKPLGRLNTRAGGPIQIEGLWGIGFGNGGAAGPRNTLYFAAGPEDEEHGLFGSIEAIGSGNSAAEGDEDPGAEE